MDTDWQQKKLDVEVDVPLTLDLEYLRSTGIQVGLCFIPEIWSRVIDRAV